MFHPLLKERKISIERGERKIKIKRENLVTDKYFTLFLPKEKRKKAEKDKEKENFK